MLLTRTVCPNFSEYLLCLTLKSHADIIVPAVRGTTSVLHSALKYGSSVKRVVLTSSFVAVFEWVPEPRVYTEENWNNAAIEAVKTKGSAADSFTVYSASKALAEKAAWEFVETNKSKILFDLVALNPPWIFGASVPFFANFSLTAN